MVQVVIMHMEYIVFEDMRRHIEVLKKFTRPVGIGEHPTLYDGGLRDNIDFKISEDGRWVEPGPLGLSFATSMKSFKRILKIKGRFYTEVAIYAIDAMTPLASFFKTVPDSPGHLSLTVVERTLRSVVINELEKLADKMEKIGVIKITP